TGSRVENMYNAKALVKLSVLLLLFSTNYVFAITDSRDVKDIGIDEKTGALVPGDIRFADENHETVELRDFFNQAKPVVLNLVYFGCPRLCNFATDGLVQVMNEQGSLKIGKDFKVLTVSFDPGDTPELASTKASKYREMVKHGDSGMENWVFLTSDAENIRLLTEAVGFRYKVDGNEFAHASALIILTPEGKISRYLPGIQYEPGDFRLSLLEASRGRIGSSEMLNKLLLFCYEFDPVGKKYALKALNVVKAAGVVTLLSICGVLTYFWRKERKEPE
ncbi:MAG: SCO family protein, partial [Candidatus Dadabacteria bacterium]|nr:SCO family protein [Candidatus Dadabacteria bacterium]